MSKDYRMEGWSDFVNEINQNCFHFNSATSVNSTIDRSHYPRSYNRMLMDTNSSQQNLINQTPMTTIPQTPENPYSYDSMPSNYRYVFSI